jgi:hypothetical protein
MSTSKHPEPQTIFVTARPLQALAADVQERIQTDHPPREGAQDLIIAAPDGVLYHVAQEVWMAPDRVERNPPDEVKQLLRLGTTLAYIPDGEAKNTYLVNAAQINVEPSDGLHAPHVGEAMVFRVDRETWSKFRFRPGNSGLILDMLTKGATVAYVPKSARTTDCMCYLINLATLNGSTLFEMTHTGPCEIPAK